MHIQEQTNLNDELWEVARDETEQLGYDFADGCEQSMIGLMHAGIARIQLEGKEQDPPVPKRC